MKTSRPKTKTLYIASSLLLAALSAGVVGCKSSGYDQGNKTAASIQTAADEIGALSGQIDATLTSLNDIVEKPQADLRPQYKTYSANLAQVESTAKNIGSARKAMAERGKQFFAKWDEQLAQIQNEDIKARSQSRKEQVMEKLQALKTDYAEAEIAFKPFLANLKDIEKYLSVDLTPGGVSAIKDSTAKAAKDAEPLKKSIAKLAEEFKALGVSMSSVRQQQQQQQQPAGQPQAK